MFETPIALVGNIVTDPIRRRVGDQDLTRFRVASNSRRKMPDGSWQAGHTLYVTVTCWGPLATGVGGSLIKGDPVVVAGHLYTNEYDDKEGNKRSANEIRAISVGPDLARSVARVSTIRRSATGQDASQQAGDASLREGDGDRGDGDAGDAGDVSDVSDGSEDDGAAVLRSA
jgi:single-strand DNA-binding protein